jgi:hypothetical protein
MVFAAMLATDVSHSVLAQSDKSDAGERKLRADDSPQEKRTPKSIEPDRAAVLKFTTQHHPELARLLGQLEKSRPDEFRRACRELTGQIQLLDRLKEKNPARYEVQLENWKLDSQIRVLMARWAVRREPEIEEQVRELLQKRREHRIAQLESERARIADQLKRMDEQLAAVSAPISSQVDREWEQLSKKATPSRSGTRKMRVPAVKPSSSDTSNPATEARR